MSGALIRTGAYRYRHALLRKPPSAPRFERLVELGGSVVHPGERWAICCDSEGSPFGLAAELFENDGIPGERREP